MQRRVALAIALALTIVTTFSIITVGARTGLFGGDDSAAALEEFTQAPAQPPPTEAPPAAPAYVPAPDPVVVTEYVYLDEPAPAGQPAAQSAAAPKPAPAPRSQPTAPPQQQPQPAAAQPTPPPAVAPTQPAAAVPAVPTAPPAAAPTSIPTSPPAPAPTSPPPAAAPSGPSELEFTGTVTAINGDIVTFSHGGTATDVRVTKGLDRLDVGTTVKVHAIKTSSGYVAKELEFGGD